MLSNSVETPMGTFSWTGNLTDKTLVTTPTGEKVSFYSIVSMTNGEALSWIDLED